MKIKPSLPTLLVMKSFPNSFVNFVKITNLDLKYRCLWKTRKPLKLKRTNTACGKMSIQLYAKTWEITCFVDFISQTLINIFERDQVCTHLHDYWLSAKFNDEKMVHKMIKNYNIKDGAMHELYSYTNFPSALSGAKNLHKNLPKNTWMKLPVEVVHSRSHWKSIKCHLSGLSAYNCK